MNTRSNSLARLQSNPNNINNGKNIAALSKDMFNNNLGQNNI